MSGPGEFPRVESNYILDTNRLVMVISYHNSLQYAVSTTFAVQVLQ